MFPGVYAAIPIRNPNSVSGQMERQRAAKIAAIEAAQRREEEELRFAQAGLRDEEDEALEDEGVQDNGATVGDGEEAHDESGGA